MMPAQDGPLEWVLQHVSAAGWPFICYCAYRIARFVTKLEDRALGVETKVVEAHSYVVKMATNELPHVQAATEDMADTLKSIDQNIAGLRSDLKK